MSISTTSTQPPDLRCLAPVRVGSYGRYRRWFLPHALLEQLGPICDGAEHVPDVDEVETVRAIGPFALHIVNLELQIGWYPKRVVRGWSGGVHLKLTCLVVWDSNQHQ